MTHCYQMYGQLILDTSLESTLTSMEDEEICIDGKGQKIADHPQIIATVRKLTPVHFLQFATGATNVPACGWSPKPPQIMFDHLQGDSMLRASTCSLKLTVPVNECTKNLTSFMFAFCISLVHGATFSAL